MHFAEKQNNI